MEKNKQQVPRLRFPGFNDAWEQRKLGDIGSFFYGGGTPNTNNSIFWNGSIPWLQSSDLSEDQVLDTVVRKHISKDGLENSAAKLIPRNSIAIVTRVGLGKVSLISYDYSTSQDFLSISELNIDKLFGAYVISDLMKKESRLAQGTSIKGITKNEVLEKLIFTPSLKEQTAIGNFFRQLDAAIASHQRKLERVKELKKSLLQKMFPKDGEAFPELRFPNFTDAWEQRKLNEISQKVTEKNVNNIYQETFTNSAEFGIINQRDFFDKDISNKANLAGYYVVQNNDFVYNPRISNFAPVGPIKRNKLGRNGVMSPLYYVFRVDSVDYQFLETYFENTQWHIFMKENGDNGARSDRFAIKDSVFSTMPILLPSQQEQTAIGNFFRQLDEAIASHQRKLEHMQALKKGLLQQMFV